MSEETERLGLQKIIESIIENTMSSKRAAELIVKLLDEQKPEAPVPTNTRPAKRQRRNVKLARLTPDAIEPDQYYPFETLVAVSGYGSAYLRKLVSAKPDELRSKKEGRSRLILGADIKKMAERRRRDETPDSGDEAA